MNEPIDAGMDQKAEKMWMIVLLCHALLAPSVIMMMISKDGGDGG